MNEMLPKILILAEFHNISLICAHVSTELKDDAIKDACHANLEDLYDKGPAHYIKSVLEDFNAKVRVSINIAGVSLCLLMACPSESITICQGRALGPIIHL